jgi:hypothetical protein
MSECRFCGPDYIGNCAHKIITIVQTPDTKPVGELLPMDVCDQIEDLRRALASSREQVELTSQDRRKIIDASDAEIASLESQLKQTQEQCARLRKETLEEVIDRLDHPAIYSARNIVVAMLHGVEVVAPPAHQYVEAAPGVWNRDEELAHLRADLEQMSVFREKLREENERLRTQWEHGETLKFIATVERDQLREALVWVLPMAKGYANEHDVGSNQKLVALADAALTPPTNPQAIKQEAGE